MRASLSLLVLLAAGGCTSLGAGRPLPYAAARTEHGWRFIDDKVYRVGGEDYRLATPEVTRRGTGPFGFTVGGRLGTATMHVGERTAGAGAAVDVRAEAHLSLGASFGVGAAIGYAVHGAKSDELEASHAGVPLTALVTWAPRPPFVLRASVFAIPGTYKADGVTTDATVTGGALAAGFSVAFPRGHFIPVVEWQRSRSTPIATAMGEQDARFSAWLFEVILVTTIL